MGRVLARNPKLFAGGLAVAVICLAGVAAPLITHSDPIEHDLVNRLKPPGWDPNGTWTHPLGTDTFGRDVFSQLLYGARYSLLVALVAVLGSGVLGVTLGAIAGYVGRWSEAVIMRAVDAQTALSTILLALMFAALYGNTLVNLLLVLTITGWSTYTRILYGVVRSIRVQEYVTAAVSIGAQPRRIIVRHVLPNMMPTIIVISTLQVGRMLLLEAGLSFLGLGVPVPLPAWGNILADGHRNIFTSPHLTMVPGLAITATVFAVNLLGDGLRRALDPRAPGMA